MRKNSVEIAEASGVCKLCAPAPVPIPAPSPMEPYTWSPIRARCKEDQFAPHQEAAGLTGLPRLTAIHCSTGQSSPHYTTRQTSFSMATFAHRSPQEMWYMAPPLNSYDTVVVAVSFIDNFSVPSYHFNTCPYTCTCYRSW